MGITLTIHNDTNVRLVGRLDDHVHNKIADLDIKPGQTWSQTDDGIRRNGSYRIRVWKNNKGTKYSMLVLAPGSRSEKKILVSEIIGKKNRSGMMKSTVGGLTMDGQIKAAIKILKKFTNQKAMDLRIPPEVIFSAKGLAFMTQSKLGLLFSVSGGLGVVLTRLPDGKWSGPSAFGCGGLGAGIQMGASITKSLLVLNNEAAVKAFSGGGQIKLGATLSVAAGPIGREAGVEARSGKGKVVACFSYAITQGLFGGVSLEGAILTPRKKENKKFYGREVKPSEILKGNVQIPEHNRLQELYLELHKLENATGMRKDGRMFRGQIAFMVVFQREEVETLLDLGLENGRINEQIDHIKAPIMPEEREDFETALHIIRNIAPQEEQKWEEKWGSRNSLSSSAALESMNSLLSEPPRRPSPSPPPGNKGRRRPPPPPPGKDTKSATIPEATSQTPRRKVPPPSRPRESLPPPPPPHRKNSEISIASEQARSYYSFESRGSLGSVGPERKEFRSRNLREKSGDGSYDLSSSSIDRKNSNFGAPMQTPSSKRRGRDRQRHAPFRGDVISRVVSQRLVSRHRREESKTIKDLKALARLHTKNDMDLLQATAQCLYHQMTEKSHYRGRHLVAWCMNGNANLLHNSIKTEAVRTQLLLVQTLISKTDEDLEDDEKKEDEDDDDHLTSGRVVELRILVLMNLLLAYGYIEPKKLSEHKYIESRGFQLDKSYRFTPRCAVTRGERYVSRSITRLYNRNSPSPRTALRKRKSSTKTKIFRFRSPSPKLKVQFWNRKSAKSTTASASNFR
mmetsp:Transcript_7906/g.11903  ORF Transcript_7906/g.11903 Transcript_7906/m.11903 type:complete len:796 (-) Transcript_7906:319-2706(-)